MLGGEFIIHGRDPRLQTATSSSTIHPSPASKAFNSPVSFTEEW